MSSLFGGRRRAVVERVGKILRQGEPTRFRFEGPLRHLLRQRLCEATGAPWWQCDGEAADVVREALRSIGLAHRPNPDESFDRITECLHCGRPLEGKDRWCSFACEAAADAAMSWRVRLWTYTADFAERIVRHRTSAAKKRFGIRKCASCGTLFEPTNKDARCCCSKCAAELIRANQAEKPCEHCGATFQPASPVNKYCSTKCRDLASYYRRTERPNLAPKPCVQCGDKFVPPLTRPDKRFCSSRCKARSNYEKRKHGQKAPS